MDAATLEQYLDYPIQAPPEGVTPNFVNPESTAYQVYITAGFCLALMAIFSMIRFMSKMYLGPRSIKTDESKSPPPPGARKKNRLGVQSS